MNAWSKLFELMQLGCEIRMRWIFTNQVIFLVRLQDHCFSLKMVHPPEGERRAYDVDAASFSVAISELHGRVTRWLREQQDE